MSNRKNVVTLENPTMEKSAKLIKMAISKHRTVILVGNCWVDYKGRASSKLEPGERIVIIKEDGSVLIHRPSGYEPVNWQPAGCFFHTNIKDDTLQIRATRRKPSESVSIFFDLFFLVFVIQLIDRGEFSLYASESDMQKAILLDPSLLEEDFRPISYEKKVEPGFVDVYGIDKNGNLVVVELKRKKAGKDAVLQLEKYVKFIKMSTNRTLRGVLVAPHLTKGVKTLLDSLGLEFKILDPKKCTDTLRKVETPKLTEFC
jgi:RecB family endonuclease NucS